MLAGPLRAHATTYTDVLNISPSSFVCNTVGDLASCGTVEYFSPRYGVAGDHYDLTVNFDSRLTAPGGRKGNGAYFWYVDSGYGPEGNPQTALVGDQPSGLIAGIPPSYPGPYYVTESHSYQGYINYCCGYTPPNSGFSIIGAHLTYDLITSDSYPIIAIALGTYTWLDSAPTELVNFLGGSLDNPAALPQKLVASLNGSISGGGPEQQMYAFGWSGGQFRASIDISGASPDASFAFEVYTLAGALLSTSPVDATTDFAGQIGLDLAPGRYVIGVTAFGPDDPAFTLNFLTPVGSNVPEPGIWSLLFFGIFGVGAIIRGERRRWLQLAT